MFKNFRKKDIFPRPDFSIFIRLKYFQYLSVLNISQYVSVQNMGLKWSGERDGFQIWFQTWSLCKTTTTFVSLHTFYENVDFNNFIMKQGWSKDGISRYSRFQIYFQKCSSSVLMFCFSHLYFRISTSAADCDSGSVRFWGWSMAKLLSTRPPRLNVQVCINIHWGAKHRCPSSSTPLWNQSVKTFWLEWNIFKCFFLLPFIALQALDAVFL